MFLDDALLKDNNQNPSSHVRETGDMRHWRASCKSVAETQHLWELWFQLYLRIDPQVISREKEGSVPVSWTEGSLGGQGAISVFQTCKNGCTVSDWRSIQYKILPLTTSRWRCSKKGYGKYIYTSMLFPLNYPCYCSPWESNYLLLQSSLSPFFHEFACLFFYLFHSFLGSPKTCGKGAS